MPTVRERLEKDLEMAIERHGSDSHSANMLRRQLLDTPAQKQERYQATAVPSPQTPSSSPETVNHERRLHLGAEAELERLMQKHSKPSQEK
jgi:hypothetical protein